MARFIVTSLLVVVAVTFAAAVEARDVAIIDASSYKLSSINRRLLGVCDAHPVDDGTDQICDKVRFKALCRSLTKLPGVTTPGALLQASVRVALTKARQAKRRVDAYAASYHGGNPVASMLDTCSTAYGGVADSLAEAQRLIDGGHATGADLNRELSAATTDALGCSDAFDERPEVPSPFPGTLRNVYRVVDDVLDIAYVVKPV